MSLVCPSCRAEYRAGFERCSRCDVALVDAAGFASAGATSESPRHALASVPRTTLFSAGLDACREIERALLSGGIAAYVDAHSEDGEVLAPGALKVGVVIAEADLQKASTLLRDRFAALVAREGLGQLQDRPIDLAAAEVDCPACGHKGALVEGACADCGLFLGAPA